MTELAVPMRVKIELEARLALAQKEAREASGRAMVAENRLSGFRRDAKAILEQAAGRLVTAAHRDEAAMTLKALARRLELEGELQGLK